MAKVFISYSHQDQDLAAGVRSYLREHSAGSIDVFLDSEIAPGTPLWQSAIREQLESSAFMVVLVPSDVSRPVLAELELASDLERRGTLRIIPVLLKDRTLLFEFNTHIAGTQRVELAPDQPEVGFEKILEEVIEAAKLEEHFVAAGED